VAEDQTAEELDPTSGDEEENGGGSSASSSAPPPAPCPPCKSGAPPWMATFADMATLLMAFFVLILSFAETNVPKYKQISGSLKAAFGVKRVVPTISIPSARSIVIEDFSPAVAQRTVIDRMTQRSEDITREFLVKKTEEKQADFETQQDFRKLEQLLAEEIKLGQVAVRIEDQQVIVEMQSQETSGGNDNKLPDTASGGPISQETIDIAAKIVDAQASLVTEVEMRKQPLAAGASEKGSTAKSTVGDATGAAQGRNQNIEDQYQKLRSDLAAEVQMGFVEVEKKDNQIIVRLASQGSFISGSADLQRSFEGILNKVGGSLAKTQGKVRVEGHTDNVPVAFSRRFNSNWDLSAARSAAVADYFINNSGLAQENITVAGFADTKPIDTNSTVDGRARNRRIEVIVDGS
jgi:chemotaxis protein MotB